MKDICQNCGISKDIDELFFIVPALDELVCEECYAELTGGKPNDGN